jgi:hypothetical protein
MKYLAIMLAALTLTAPAFSQRTQGPHKRPQARVEAHKGSDLLKEVKSLRKELEALKKEVAELKKGRGSSRRGDVRGRGRKGSGSSQGTGAKRGRVLHEGRGRWQGELDRRKKGEKRVEVERPDWEAIRKRMEEFRKSRK